MVIGDQRAKNGKFARESKVAEEVAQVSHPRKRGETVSLSNSRRKWRHAKRCLTVTPPHSIGGARQRTGSSMHSAGSRDFIAPPLYIALGSCVAAVFRFAARAYGWYETAWARVWADVCEV